LTAVFQQIARISLSRKNLRALCSIVRLDHEKVFVLFFLFCQKL
jgi:hypothetical protein